MTAIRLQDGKAIVEDGRVGIADACCCQCCTCESLFSFYANGRVIESHLNINDNINFDLTGFALQFVALIPGLGFANGSWANSGCATEYECDVNANLVARITLTQRGQHIVDPENMTFVAGRVIESRYYRFNLEQGGCGIIEGVPIAVPEGASTAGDALISCGSNPGVAGNIDGEVIRYVTDLEDADAIGSAPLHLDWDSISIHASCQIHCNPSLIFGAENYATTSCEEANVDCEDCECQPSEVGLSDGYSLGGPDPFGNSYFQCAINPLP